jgi:hypothetical protein
MELHADCVPSVATGASTPGLDCCHSCAQHGREWEVDTSNLSQFKPIYSHLPSGRCDLHMSSRRRLYRPALQLTRVRVANTRITSSNTLGRGESGQVMPAHHASVLEARDCMPIEASTIMMSFLMLLSQAHQVPSKLAPRNQVHQHA